MKNLDEHPDNSNYGYNRIRTALQQHGITVSNGTVRRAMRDGGLLHKRRTPRGITKADSETQERENLIKRDFHSADPLTKLLTDITEIACKDESCMFLLLWIALTVRLSLLKCMIT